MNNLDSRSQLEREFDDPNIILSVENLARLVIILKTERDAWKYNFQQAEKDRQKLLEKIKLLEGAVNILRD